ncbi:MAG: DUF4446 family protein [Candidatus Nanopelagicales bacterium]
MSLDQDLVQYLALGGAIAGGLALLVAFSAHLRIGALRRTLRGLDPVAGGSDDVRGVTSLRDEVGRLDARVARAEVDLVDTIRHVSVVRYDAFQDMGGRMSFSAAMLDDVGDGLVISAINGRSETRAYAKGVKAGGSEMALSPEEQEAINAALRGRS